MYLTVPAFHWGLALTGGGPRLTLYYRLSPLFYVVYFVVSVYFERIKKVTEVYWSFPLQAFQWELPVTGHRRHFTDCARGDHTSHSILMSVCALKGEGQIVYLVYFKRSQVYLVYLMKRRIHLVVLNLLKLRSILSRRILPGRRLRKSTLKSTPSDTVQIISQLSSIWYHVT